MDERSIALSLASKGLSAMEIDNDLIVTLGSDAIGSRSVMRFLRHSNEAILLALTEQLFASIRQLSRLTHVLPTPVDRRLTHSLSFQVGHVRWIPHRLSDSQKSDRV
jgi:hypothetical protein